MTARQNVPSILENPDHRVILECWPDSVRVKVIVGRSSLYVHVDPAALRAALDEVAPAGSYTRTDSPDYADGGVTAAAIEKETRQPRPLTPDDITDEMVERALNTYRDVRSQQGYVLVNNDRTQEAMSHALRVALTEPQRPEGAEEIESQIEAWSMSPDGGALNAAQHRTLADFLASRGVRVTGAGS